MLRTHGLALQIGLSLVFAVGAFSAPRAAAAERVYAGGDFTQGFEDAGPLDSDNSEAYAEAIKQQRRALKAYGFTPWRWGESTCHDCPLVIVRKNQTLETQETYEFTKSIEARKVELLRLYPKASGQEYNLLAHMAVGILGCESNFFQSRRYKLKEFAPGFISALKVTRAYAEYYARNFQNNWNWESLTPEERERALNDQARVPANSRGPTGMKQIPERIAKNFGVTKDSLYDPDHAALATMGYLLEALAELKQRAAAGEINYVNKSNYVDYLPYIYFGSKWKLMPDPSSPGNKPNATPADNLYIKDMKTYMGWVELYEALPQNSAGTP